MKKFMPWFEDLNRVYQIVVIALFFLGVLGTALTAGWSFWTAMLDARIRRHVDPVADMVEFSLKASGQWDAYLEEKAHQERDRRAREARQARPNADSLDFPAGIHTNKGGQKWL